MTERQDVEREFETCKRLLIDKIQDSLLENWKEIAIDGINDDGQKSTAQWVLSDIQDLIEEIVYYACGKIEELENELEDYKGGL